MVDSEWVKSWISLLSLPEWEREDLASERHFALIRVSSGDLPYSEWGVSIQWAYVSDFKKKRRNPLHLLESSERQSKVSPKLRFIPRMEVPATDHILFFLGLLLLLPFIHRRKIHLNASSIRVLSTGMPIPIENLLLPATPGPPPSFWMSLDMICQMKWSNNL